MDVVADPLSRTSARTRSRRGASGTAVPERSSTARPDVDRLLRALDHLANGNPETPPEAASRSARRPARDGHGRTAALDGRGRGRWPRRSPSRRIRRVLVTGGAGYVGSHLVRKLLARGHRVRVLDSFLYGDQGLAELAGHPRLELIEGDIRHLGTWPRRSRASTASSRWPPSSGTRRATWMSTRRCPSNLEATRLLAETCQRRGSAGWCSPPPAASTAPTRTWCSTRAPGSTLSRCTPARRSAPRRSSCGTRTPERGDPAPGHGLRPLVPHAARPAGQHLHRARLLRPADPGLREDSSAGRTSTSQDAAEAFILGQPGARTSRLAARCSTSATTR